MPCSARVGRWSRWAALFLTWLLAAPATAVPITYQVRNHPDGSAIRSGVDEDGYVLRLDLRERGRWRRVNTFNANHSLLTFSWDPASDPGKAVLGGTVFHNESGTTRGFDPEDDDPWQLEVTFRAPFLTDERGDPWFGARPSDRLFDDTLAALLGDANFPGRGKERRARFSNRVARLYFGRVDLELYPLVPDPVYEGPRTWDEFPNGRRKNFFMQFRWRLWDDEFAGGEFEHLAATGWLEPLERGRRVSCCQDLLFLVTDRIAEEVPEPGSLAFFSLGLLGLALARRR